MTIYTREEYDSVSGGKKKHPELSFFMSLSFVTQLTRAHEDWGKQHEEAEHAHSPALSIYRAGNFQEMKMP